MAPRCKHQHFAVSRLPVISGHGEFMSTTLSGKNSVDEAALGTTIAILLYFLHSKQGSQNVTGAE